MTSGNAHYIFYALNHDDNLLLRVEFRYSSSNYQVRADTVNDNWSWSQTAWVTISDAPHAIEFDWQAATAAGANDGVLSFWVDGVQQGNFTNLDNDTRRIDYVQWGIVGGVDNGSRGTMYFDAFASRRESYVGLTSINSGMGQAAQISAPLTASSMPQNPFQSGAMLQSLQPGVNVAAITYTYDSLYRLTGANYSDGTYFHYTYDAVGNRLTQESVAITNTYAYDAANRLASVDGVPYTWDNNGNLLNDGAYTYTYNHANQLVSVSGAGTTVNYSYNGQGDRVSQTTGITTTTYTLDLAAGLTQVLSDGTDTYLYGNGRIAQSDASGAQYFLGDALGSVRQLVDVNGDVLLAQSYEPYGEVLASVGEGESSYGFAAEMRDPTGLIFLRARYYNSRFGRFLSKDTWPGDDNRPLSLNGWNYVEENPINYSDPTGRCLDEDGDGICEHHQDPKVPLNIDPNQLRVIWIGARESEISKYIDEVFECKINRMSLPIKQMRQVTVFITPYLGVRTFSYDKGSVTQPVTRGDSASLMRTGAASVIIRTVLAEIGGARLRYNIHSVAEGIGIIYTAFNRSNISSWKCFSTAGCMLVSTQYAITSSGVMIAWDPLCQSFYTNCYSAYGGTYNQNDYLQSIDLAATSYYLFESGMISDFTQGSDRFAHSDRANHEGHTHFYISHFENGIEVGGTTEDKKLADVFCEAYYQGKLYSCKEYEKIVNPQN
jgi:RHS repeat-associated protein